MRDKTIAITGHSGIIGSNFLNKFKNNKYIRCNFDIRNRKKVFQWIKENEFDIFLHLAAIVPIKKVNKDKTKTHKINFNGTKNIVDAINKYKKSNVWLFYSSTSHVYGSSKNLKPFRETSRTNPKNFYAKTKILSEQYIKKNIRKKNITYCIGRIFSFTDRKQDLSFFVPRIFREILGKKNTIIKLKNPHNHRDFIHVQDILHIINLLYKKKSKGIFNIASGEATSLKNIVDKIIKISKSKKKIQTYNITKVNNIIGDISKIKKHLNWQPKTNILRILNSFLKKYN
tara:strand:+ start:2084 stop:2941 length:858 start_codon:yes stop_codon:yes gene_type:complete